MNSKRYDQLKFIALIGLPALGSLYFALAGIWGLPFADQISGTVLAIDTALGLYLKWLSTQYEKTSDVFAGNLMVTKDDETGKKELYLAVNESNLDALGNQSTATFKVIQK